MPGMYRFERNPHHDMVINEQRYTSADIKLCEGHSIILSRKSTDPEYQSELLQESLFYHLTKTGHLAEMAEQRVFRLRNGEWSYWSTNGDGEATKKITDLVFNDDTSTPRLRAKQQPFVDRNGVIKHLGLTFYMSDTPWWEMHRRIRWPDGQETVEGTTYFKIAEHRQKGWLEWLAEAVKAGFEGMREYRIY